MSIQRNLKLLDKENFPFWIIFEACQDPIPLEEARKLERKLRKHKRLSAKLSILSLTPLFFLMWVVEKYVRAFPRELGYYPPDFHQVCALIERDLREHGVSSGYDFKESHFYAFDRGLQEKLRKANFYLFPPLGIKQVPNFIAPYKVIYPNPENFKFWVRLKDPNSFISRAYTFKSNLEKSLGKNTVERLSNKIREYSAWSLKKLYEEALLAVKEF